MESIEHGTFMDDEVIDEMVRRGTFVVPTFVAGTWVRRYGERAPDSLHPQSMRKSQEAEGLKEQAFRVALEAGVRVAFGTDMGVGPHGRNAEELELMVAAGMTPCRRSSQPRRGRASAFTWPTRSARWSRASWQTC